MLKQPDPKTSGRRVVYHIRLEGQLDRTWEGWFGGLRITPEEDGTTLLSGPVVDQAALYGLLRKVRDLGLPLVLVARVGSYQVDTSDGENTT